MNGLVIPNNNDVLAGRGNGSNRHPGNWYYRAVVSDQKEEYAKGSRMKKKVVIKRVLEQIQSRTPPGRFLENVNGKWYCMKENYILRKIGQSLRECPKNETTSVYTPDLYNTNFDQSLACPKIDEKTIDDSGEQCQISHAMTHSISPDNLTSARNLPKSSAMSHADMMCEWLSLSTRSLSYYEKQISTIVNNEHELLELR